MKNQDVKKIIILGGSYAGLSTAHRILKQAPKAAPFKITIVAPNTHHYWNMASPRGVIPGQFADEKLFEPIAAGFNQYPASRFKLVHGFAESIDTDLKTVNITSPNGSETLNYDFLIVATGSHTKDGTPFKMLSTASMLDTTEVTRDALHDFQSRIKKAQTIGVGGAGITGVEVSGEIAYEYGSEKQVTLIASGPTIVEGSPVHVTSLATKQLQDLGVKVKTQTKILEATRLPNGQTELTLSTKEKLVVDMYIPAFGVTPNSSFIPTKFLNPNGFVKVDEYLQVKGTDSVWAIGDVSDREFPQFKVTNSQSAHLAKNMVAVLSNKTPLPYKPSTVFKGFSVGRKSGTGHFGTTKIPTFIVIIARKNLFTPNLQPTVDGSLF